MYHTRSLDPWILLLFPAGGSAASSCTPPSNARASPFRILSRTHRHRQPPSWAIVEQRRPNMDTGWRNPSVDPPSPPHLQPPRQSTLALQPAPARTAVPAQPPSSARTSGLQGAAPPPGTPNPCEHHAVVLDGSLARPSRCVRLRNDGIRRHSSKVRRRGGGIRCQSGRDGRGGEGVRRRSGAGVRFPVGRVLRLEEGAWQSLSIGFRFLSALGKRLRGLVVAVRCLRRGVRR